MNTEELLLKAKWFIRDVCENAREPSLREIAGRLVEEIELHELAELAQLVVATDS